MTCGIYEIVNNANGKRYVGSSVDIEKRWRHHLWRLGRGDHHSPALQRAWNKYGGDKFIFNVILECHEDVIHQEEQVEIDYKSEYNVSPVAGSSRGHRWTDEQKARHSQSKIDFYKDPKTREVVSLAARKSHSRPEVRERISIRTREGQSNPNVRGKMSERAKKMWECPSYRAKMSEMSRLMSNRPEHKEALLIANKRPKNTTIYHYTHQEHGDRICTQWELKQEFPYLASSKVSQLSSGKRPIHKGWTLKKAPN